MESRSSTIRTEGMFLFCRDYPAKSNAEITLRAFFSSVATNDRTHLENRQKHRHDNTTNDHAETYNKQRFDQRGKRSCRGINLGVIKIRDFRHHAINIAGGLTGLYHVHDNGREKSVC